MNPNWIVIATVGVALAAPALQAQERAASGEERRAEGRRMFMEQGCYGCHMVQKVGTPIGPDLSRVGTKYSESYLKNWLRDPALQRPAAHMPKLELTETQIAALAAFLASLE
jgi:cbb3-type cytochrome oxidase cytochrome c subunit